MAASDARPVPRRNVAYRVTFPILDADGDPVTGATGLDSEVSKDGGTFTDAGSEATEIATASGVYFLDLTNTEMDADTVAVRVQTTSSGAKTTIIVMYPESIGDYRADVQQWLGVAPNALNNGLVQADVQRWLNVVVNALVTGDVPANTKQWAGAAVAVPTVAGVPEVDVTHWIGAVVNALVSGDVPANLKQWLGVAPNALATGRVDASVGAMQTAVITAAAHAVDSIDAAALAVSAGQEIADRVLERAIQGGTDTGRKVKSALRRIRNKVSISGGTMTVTEEDDTTTDHTAAVTTAAGDPITSVDPT